MRQSSKHALFQSGLAVLIAVWLSGCIHDRSVSELIAAANNNSESQMQARSRQTREYDDLPSDILFKAAMNVLQDEGYIIKNAVPQVGLIAAVREIDITDSDERTLKSLFFGQEARWDQRARIEATINTTPLGSNPLPGRTRVRVTFQIGINNNVGEMRVIEEIRDPDFYRDFFSKLDKSIFLAKESL